jgi:hypothetical protein
MKSVQDGHVLSKIDTLLPTLAPGESWSGEVQCVVLGEDYVISIGIIRSMGFEIIKRISTSEGELFY